MDTFSLILLGGVGLWCMRSAKTLLPATPMVGSPSAELEVDPTRWRHNGQQPFGGRDGNQEPLIDEQTAKFAQDWTKFVEDRPIWGADFPSTGESYY